MATERSLVIGGACAIALAILAAIIIAELLPLNTYPNTITIVSNVSEKSSSTLPCSAKGVSCGGFTIDSVFLYSPHPPNSSLLILTITNSGNTTLAPVTITINNQTVAKEQELDIRQTVNLDIQLPQNISIMQGQTYTLGIESSAGGPEFGSFMPVVAN